MIYLNYIYLNEDPSLCIKSCITDQGELDQEQGNSGSKNQQVHVRELKSTSQFINSSIFSMNTEIPKQKGKTPNEKNANEKGGLEEYLIANENRIGAKIWLK
jgi:hypothetical protein